MKAGLSLHPPELMELFCIEKNQPEIERWRQICLEAPSKDFIPL